MTRASETRVRAERKMATRHVYDWQSTRKRVFLELEKRVTQRKTKITFLFCCNNIAILDMKDISKLILKRFALWKMLESTPFGTWQHSTKFNSYAVTKATTLRQPDFVTKVHVSCCLFKAMLFQATDIPVATAGSCCCTGSRNLCKV